MLTNTQIQQLLEISLAGSRIGQVLPARDICTALLTLKPGFAPARIALAFSHMVVDEFDEARVLLHEVLQSASADAPLAVTGDNGDNDALVLLGLTETLAKNNDDARKALNAVCANIAAEDDPRVVTAKTLLGHLDAQ